MDKRIINRQKIQSEEGNILSGLPQGTVLAAILFVIMISDIDKIVKKIEKWIRE